MFSRISFPRGTVFRDLTVALIVTFACPSMANDLLNGAARCDDFNRCVDIMLAATDPRSPETIGVAVARIGEMPKPQKGNRKVARELNSKGLEAFRKGDLSSASSLLGRGALEDPADVEIQSNLGLVLVRERRLPEAKIALTNAITLNPRRTGAWIPMAELFFESGETEKSKGALLLAWEFSENREKTVAYFEKQAVDDGKMRVVYSSVLAVLTPSKPIAAASPLEGQPKSDSKMVYKRELVAMLKEQRRVMERDLRSNAKSIESEEAQKVLAMFCFLENAVEYVYGKNDALEKNVSEERMKRYVNEFDNKVSKGDPDLTRELMKCMASFKDKAVPLLDLDDVRLDIASLKGKFIRVQAIGAYVFDTFQLRKSEMDMSPVIVNIEKLDRASRKQIMQRCANPITPCRVVVEGKAEKNLVQIVINAETIQWR